MKPPSDGVVGRTGFVPEDFDMFPLSRRVSVVGKSTFRNSRMTSQNETRSLAGRTLPQGVPNFGIGVNPFHGTSRGFVGAAGSVAASDGLGLARFELRRTVDI